MIAYVDVAYNEEEKFFPDQVLITNGDIVGCFKRNDSNGSVAVQLASMAIRLLQYVRNIYPDSAPAEILVKTCEEKMALERIYNLSEILFDERVPTKEICEATTAFESMACFAECLKIIE